MKHSPDPGALKHRCHFEAKETTPDGGGGFATAWVPQLARWGALAFMRLSAHLETLQQGELKAGTRATLTIREDAETRLIEPEWRVRVAEGGYRERIWEIGNIIRPAPGWLRLTVTHNG